MVPQKVILNPIIGNGIERSYNIPFILNTIHFYNRLTIVLFPIELFEKRILLRGEGIQLVGTARLQYCNTTGNQSILFSPYP